MFMKKNVTITLDVDLFEEAKEQRLNLSGTLNEYLRDALKPKKADFVKEDLTLQIVSFGKNLGLSGDESVFTHENLHISVDKIWKNYKTSFSPKFTVFDYMDIRKKFEERFFQYPEKLDEEANVVLEDITEVKKGELKHERTNTKT